MAFGTSEHITCLTDVPSRDGEALCLGYKYSFFEIVLPAHVSDDGYVLSVKGTSKYYSMSPETLADNVRTGELQLPPYALSTSTYLYGYSFWPVLVIVTAIFYWMQKSAKSQLAKDLATPVSTTGPEITRVGDRYIQEQIAGKLKKGERITHQAYGMGSSGLGGVILGAATKGLLAAITNERLFLISTRAGALGPLLENRKLEVFDKAQIAEIRRSHRTLIIELVDGSARSMEVGTRKGKFSNQAAFLRDAARLFVPKVPAKAVRE